VLGDGRLLSEGRHNLSDRPLGPDEIAQDLPLAGFSDRVEYVRSGVRSCHDENTHPYGNISSVLLV
jgi:hypothetical protein